MTSLRTSAWEATKMAADLNFAECVSFHEDNSPGAGVMPWEFCEESKPLV